MRWKKVAQLQNVANSKRQQILRVTLVVPPVRPQLMMVDVCLFLFASLSLLLIHMHPCTRAHMSDSFHGWEIRASAQPTNAPAQTQPHYPMPSREVRSTQPPAQTPPRATRHPQHLTDHDPGGHTSNPWNVPGTCLPIPSERSPPEWVGGKKNQELNKCATLTRLPFDTHEHKA